MACHVRSCHVMPCPTMPRRWTRCQVMSINAMSGQVRSGQVTSGQVWSGCAMHRCRMSSALALNLTLASWNGHWYSHPDGVVWYCVAWSCLVHYGMIMVRCGVVWYGMVWYGMVWSGIVGLELQKNKNIGFRMLGARIPQRPPDRFKIVPDSRLEATGFLMRRTTVYVLQPSWKRALIFDVCGLLIFIVAQPYALVEVSLQGVRLCGIGAGRTYPNINQRIRT